MLLPSSLNYFLLPSLLYVVVGINDAHSTSSTTKKSTTSMTAAAAIPTAFSFEPSAMAGQYLNVTVTNTSSSGAQVGPMGIPYTVDVSKIVKGTSGTSLTGTTNVYVIYYGHGKNDTSFFTPARLAIVSDFVKSVSSSSWFSTAKSSYGVGNVKLGDYWVMDCASDWYAKGCTLGGQLGGNINDLTGIIWSMIDAAPTAFAVGGYAYETRGFPKDPTAFYLVIGSPEMPEQAPNLATINTVVGPLPPSKCLFPINLKNSPNGDVQIDQMITILAHELIEVLVSPIPFQTWADSDGNEVMDKCETWIAGLQTTHDGKSQWNAVFGSRKFVVPMIWDRFAQQCSTIF